MSGKYPNGGYRNKAAVELSMPRQATPPGVTTRGPAPGNTLPPLQGEIIAPNRGGSRGGGIESWGNTRTPSKGGTTITIDRGRFDGALDDSKLTPDQRERLRGLHRIDLKPNEYRVNGRSYAMRMAIRLARQILGVGKRIPKSVYLELLQVILEELLKLLDREVLTKKETTLSGEWQVVSYGTDMSAGAAVEAADKRHPSAVTGPLPIGYISPPVDLIYDPKNGRSQVGNPSWPFPVEIPYLAPISGQAVGQTQTANLRYRGIWQKTTNLDPRASWQYSRWSHVLTMATGNASAPWYTEVLINWPGPVNAPYPYSPPQGGNNPPKDPPLPKPDNDKKIKFPGIWLDTVWMATEWAETIDCIYKALPRNKQYGRDYNDKMHRIAEALDKVDWSAAAACWAQNQITDKYWGKVFDYVDKARRKRPGSGGTSQDPWSDIQIEIIEG